MMKSGLWHAHCSHILSTSLRLSFFALMFLSLTGVLALSAVQAAPVSQAETTPIATIQSSIATGDDSALVGQPVTVAGIVTSVYGDLFFVQDQAGGPWSGIAVFQRRHGVAVGDLVQVAGTVTEFHDLTEIIDAVITVQSQGNPLPAPVVLTAAQAADEQWEGILVQVNDARIISSPNRFGEWTVRDETGTIRVDDKGVAYPAKVGEELASVTGVLDHAFDSYRLLPRTTADIQALAAEEPPLFTLPDNLTPIYEIQGDGPSTPLSLKRVSALGLVSGVQSNGFYFQDPAGDGDPATSDGIFVYTSSRPPVQPGDCALVRAGEVSEYYEKTELSRALFVESIPAQFCGEGDLPAVPTQLPGPNLDPVAMLEPLEGMVVAFEALAGTVQGPTKRFRNGDVELAIIAEASQPFVTGGRVFQHNPDDAAGLIFLSNGLGADLPEVAWGDRVAVQPAVPGELVRAVIDYSFGKYLFLLLPGQNLTVESRSQAPEQASPPDESAFRVCSFNVLGLGRGSDQFPNQAEYEIALRKRATAIADGLQGCEIIGLQETGKPEDAQNLAQVLAEEHGLDYTAIGFAGPGTASSEFPLTNSLLLRTDRVTLQQAKIDQGCSRYSFSVRLVPGQCPARRFPIFSRPPLVVDMLVAGPWGETYPLTVVVNHWKSKRGDESVNVVRRTLQAEHVASIVQAKLDADPDAHVVVLGDLNDFYGSAPVLALEQGTTPALFHTFDTLAPQDRYTYNFNGASQVLDHLLMTQAMLPHFGGVDVLHIDADYPVPAQTDPTTVVRSSDHDPLLLTVRPGGSGWIEGNVQVEGVLVTLTDDTGRSISETVSDSLGDFRFFDLVPATYGLILEAPSEVTLLDAPETVSVSQGEATVVNAAARHVRTEVGAAGAAFSSVLGALER